MGPLLWAALFANLLAGTSVWAPPGPDEPLERRTFRDWDVVCRPGEPGVPVPPPDPRCVMEQTAAAGGFEIVARAGWLSAPGVPAMIVSISPEIPEGEGVLVTVDGKARAAPAVDLCAEGRCLAHIRLDETVLPAFVQGHRAVLSFPDNTGRQVRVPLSLLGFTRAYLAQRRG